MVVVNLKGVTTGFDPVPIGIYRVRLTNHEIYKSKTNNDAFKVTCTIVDPEEYAGRVLRPFNSSLQPNALFNFKRVIAAFGAPEDVLEHESVNVDMVLRELRGNEADVNVSMGEYNNRAQNELYFYVPGELESLSQEQPASGWEAPPAAGAAAS